MLIISGEEQPQAVAANDTQNGSADALDEGFDQEQAADGAAGGPQGTQHADVMPAFHHHRAKGVIDHEGAHRQGQHAEDEEGGLADFDGGKHLGSGLDGIDAHALTQTGCQAGQPHHP